MPFEQRGEIRYFTFASFPSNHVVQAVFTRRGGVSPEPWSGLNVGGTVGDSQERVAENRRRAFAALQRVPTSVYDVWQVHSAQVVHALAPRPPEKPHLKADAILTDRPEVTLFMRFADCVPVLLFDPRQSVVGLVHAGWQGTVKRVAAAAVRAMEARYGSRPADILAGIGPSIGSHHYPVGQDVIDRVEQAFGPGANALLSQPNGSGPAGQDEGTNESSSHQSSTLQFDLWAANRMVLEEAGVEAIEAARLCTACHPDDWFSHRGEAGRTGRFGALIGLRD